MLSFRLNRHSDLSMLAHRLIDFKIYIVSARTLDEYFFFVSKCGQHTANVSVNNDFYVPPTRCSRQMAYFPLRTMPFSGFCFYHTIKRIRNIFCSSLTWNGLRRKYTEHFRHPILSWINELQIKYTTKWENIPSDMRVQRRRKSACVSDLPLRCPHE